MTEKEKVSLASLIKRLRDGLCWDIGLFPASVGKALEEMRKKFNWGNPVVQFSQSDWTTGLGPDGKYHHSFTVKFPSTVPLPSTKELKEEWGDKVYGRIVSSKRLNEISFSVSY